MDPLISTSLDTVRQQRRTRVLQVTQCVLVLVSAVFIYRAIAWDIVPRQISLVVAVCIVFCSHFILRAGLQAVSAHLTLFAVVIAAFTSVLTSGGPTSIATAWLLIIPPLAGLLLDLRSIYVWIVGLFLMLVLLVLLDAAGVKFPDLTPENERTKQNYTHVLAQLGSLSAMIIAFVQTFVSYEASLVHQLQKLRSETEQRAKAEQSAIQASLAKSRFMANMNHELRTPLNSIMGYSRRLLKAKKADPERTRSALEAVLRNSEDLLAIVNELLDMSELEGSTKRFLWREVVVADVIRAVLDKHQHANMLSPLKVINCGGVDATIVADPQYLERALFNIIRFIQYSVSQGEISVQVASAKRAPYECVIGISISGQKLDLAYLQSLFNLDDREVRTGDEDCAVAGMGLPLSNRIIQLHDGEIRVEANNDNGVDFCLYLRTKPLLASVQQRGPGEE